MIIALLRRTPIFVPILALSAVAIILCEIFMADEPSTVETERRYIPPAPTQSRPVLDPVATFATIVERPLFSPNRRPAQPPPPQPAASASKIQQAPPPALSATLVGVFISPGTGSAIVRLANGKSSSLSEGETVDGWVLRRVTPDLAQFTHGTTTVELTFPVHDASTAGASTPATPGAPVRRRR